MAFWSDNLSSEPLRQHRWYIEFGASDLNGYRFALKSCTKPEYDIGVSEHVLLNHTFRYPKNLVWKPITIKMVAVTEGSSAETTNISLTQRIFNFLKAAGYHTPTPYNDKESETNISKVDACINGLSQGRPKISIIQIDSNGKSIERIDLWNAFITNVKFGSLSYDSENFVDLDFNISYDYAKIYTGDPPDDSGLNIQNLVIPYLNIDLGLMNPLSVMQNEDRKKQISPGFPNGNRR